MNWCLGLFKGLLPVQESKKAEVFAVPAWQNAETLIVADVEKFPGHIACSSLSRSEIVIPLFKDGEVSGVLDVDSDELDEFDETDKKYLEQIVSEILTS